MAKELLPEQELCSGRYVVVRVQSFSDEGGLYKVKRREDATVWALKEMIPPPSLSDEDLEKRVESLREAVELLTAFDHANLSKVAEHFSEGRRQYVVMEWVDGITLEKLMEMSVKPQPEDLCLQWGLDLCSAMNYLHDRPNPFIFNVLELSHIMFNPEDNKLKLVNYGLDRFVVGQEEEYRGGSAHGIAADVARFATVISVLLTKNEPGPFGLTQQDPVSPQLAQVLNRALSGDPRKGFGSFADVHKALDRILHPPVQQEVKRRLPIFSRWIRWDLHISRLWEQFLWNFFRQPLYLIGIELVFCVLMSFILWRVTHPPLLPRQGQAVYVACQNQIVQIQPGERRIHTRIRLDSEVGRVTASRDQTRLYASQPGSNHVLVFNTLTNRRLGFIPVDNGPMALSVDESGRYLLVVHPESGSVAVVRLETIAPVQDAEDRYGPTKDRVVGLIPVGPGADSAICLDPKARPAASPAGVEAGLGGARDLYVYATGSKGNELSAWMADKAQVEQVASGVPNAQLAFKSLAKVFIQDPGAMLASGERLLVAQADRNTISTLSLPSLKLGQVLTRLEADQPIQMLVSPEGKELWVLNRGGSLSLLTWPKLEFRATVKLDGKPSQAAFIQVGERLELWVAMESTNQVVIVRPSGRSIDHTISVGAPATSICPVD